MWFDGINAVVLDFRYLTNKGTEYLRTYLHLPAEIVPSTYKRTLRSEVSRVRSTAGGPRTEGSKNQEDRNQYRRAPGASGGPDKKGDVGPGASDVEFVRKIDDSEIEFQWY